MLLQKTLIPMKRSKKKKRLIGVEFTLDGIPKVELNTLQIGAGFIDGRFQVRIKTEKQEISTNAVRGFQREGKPGFNLKKIYHRSSSNSMEHTAYLEGFDTLYAVDTNQKQIMGETYSVGVVAELQWKIKEHGFFDIDASVLDYFPWIGKEDKLENRNWMTFIERYLMEQKHATIKAGIIVDSDLGLIDRYNSRSLPIYKNFYLPENIELIYASADIKNDTIINHLISFCDEVSTGGLKEMEVAIYQQVESLRNQLIVENPDHVDEIKAFYENRLGREC